MVSVSIGYKQLFGVDGLFGLYQDFDCVNLFFVIGVNMVDCYLILFLWMMDCVKVGVKLIVVDLCCIGIVDKVDLFLQIWLGIDFVLVNGLLYLLYVNGCIDVVFIDVYIEGWDVMFVFFVDYMFECVVGIIGFVEVDICMVV